MYKDVFVLDRKTDTYIHASLGENNAQIIMHVSDYKLSTDGRFVAFITASSNLVSSDTNAYADVFVRDLVAGTTERVSVDSNGAQVAAGASGASLDISKDGRYVSFVSRDDILAGSTTGGASNLFVRDRLSGTTTLLSENIYGLPANSDISGAVMSCDGSRIAFFSSASDLVSDDINGVGDVFVKDRINNTTTNITYGNAWTSGGGPDISCDGSTVVYTSNASNLVNNDTNNARDMFAYKIDTESTIRVNLDSNGNEVSYNINPTYNVYWQDMGKGVVDFSGRYIVFYSAADGIVPEDTNGEIDIFIRDITDGVTQIVSKRSSSESTDKPSAGPRITPNGREVLYRSLDAGLVAGDTNGKYDVFISQTGIWQ